MGLAVTFFKVDFATGNVYTSPDGTTYTQIANVQGYNVVQRYRAATNDFQGGIDVIATDAQGVAAILAVAPLVVTTISKTANAMVVPTKRIRSRNGDVIKLFSGATLLATINADGGAGTFGSEGDAPSVAIAG